MCGQRGRHGLRRWARTRKASRRGAPLARVILVVSCWSVGSARQGALAERGAARSSAQEGCAARQGRLEAVQTLLLDTRGAPWSRLGSDPACNRREQLSHWTLNSVHGGHDRPVARTDRNERGTNGRWPGCSAQVLRVPQGTARPVGGRRTRKRGTERHLELAVA